MSDGKRSTSGQASGSSSAQGSSQAGPSDVKHGPIPASQLVDFMIEQHSIALAQASSKDKEDEAMED
ncbi:hypothetical protein BGZ99_004033, partial [Dissophora globulifera]